VSINLYREPTYRIIPHKDGRGTRSTIVSLGSHTTLDFYRQPTELPIIHTEVYAEIDAHTTPTTRLLLQPNSMLLCTGPSFTDFVHAIFAAESDRLDAATYGNFHLLNLHRTRAEQHEYRDGDTFARAPRISIVAWP